jgi:hypothetical protein
MKRLLLLSMTWISVFAVAQDQCGFPASLIKSGFERGEQPAFAILPSETTPVSINVQSPSAAITVSVGSIQVFGTYTGPANTGISVNNVPVISNGSHFVSPRITLAIGSNTITIRYATLDQLPTTITRTVTYDPNLAQPVLLTASSPGDYTPVRMQFLLSTKLPPGQNLISRVQIDYNGDGVFEFDGTQPGNLEYAFELSGNYSAKARVTFDDGDPKTPLEVREDTTQIIMQDLAFTRQTLCGVYYAMKSRLAANQQTQALNTLMPAIRPRFQQTWAALAQANALGTAASRLGQVIDGQFARSTVELDIAIPTATAGVFRGYSVRIRKDPDGVWRIANM